MSESEKNLEDLLEIKSKSSNSARTSSQSSNSSSIEDIARKIGKQVAQNITTLQGDYLAMSEMKYSPSRTNNYRTTRLLSMLFKLLAWVFLLLTGLAVAGAVFIYGESYTYYNNYQLGLEFYMAVFGVILTLPMSPIFALLSESINVILDTEANTRQSATTLERILRSQA